MQAITGHTYAQIQNGSVIWLFTSANLPEWNATDITVADITGVSPAPNVGWAATQSGGSWTFAPPVVPAPTVQGAVAALAAMLSTKEALGIHFTPTGGTDTVFPTDPSSVAKYTAAWNALNTTPPLAADGDIYIAANGTPVPMSMVDAKALITKALAYFRACNANYGTLHAAVAANPLADITVGWPTNT